MTERTLKRAREDEGKQVREAALEALREARATKKARVSGASKRSEAKTPTGEARSGKRKEVVKKRQADDVTSAGLTEARAKSQATVKAAKADPEVLTRPALKRRRDLENKDLRASKKTKVAGKKTTRPHPHPLPNASSVEAAREGRSVANPGTKAAPSHPDPQPSAFSAEAAREGVSVADKATTAAPSNPDPQPSACGAEAAREGETAVGPATKTASPHPDPTPSAEGVDVGRKGGSVTGPATEATSSHPDPRPNASSVEAAREGEHVADAGSKPLEEKLATAPPSQLAKWVEEVTGEEPAAAATSTPSSAPSESTGLKRKRKATATTEGAQEPSRAKRQRISGVYNYRNSCYLNAVMQCFLQTDVLREAYLPLQRQVDEDEAAGTAIGGSSTRGAARTAAKVLGAGAGQELELTPWFGHMLASMDATGARGESATVSPRLFATALSELRPQFTPGSVQDSQEFFTDVLNQLKAEEQTAALLKGEDGAQRTVVDTTFEGEVVYHLACSACEKQWESTDPFLSLGLSIPTVDGPTGPARTGKVTLTECFDAWSKRVEVEGRKCPGCERATVSQSSMVKTAPAHFVAQLIRCGGGKVMNRRGQAEWKEWKLEHSVAFPLDDLELAEPISATKLNYRLYGVVEHCGSRMSTGHYVAYVRRDDKWWKADDAKVTEATASQVARAKPYLLFYQKR